MERTHHRNPRTGHLLRPALRPCAYFDLNWEAWQIEHGTDGETLESMLAVH